MSMTDPIADLLTRIRNGQRAGKPEVSAVASRLKVAVVKVLKDEGYIADYAVVRDGQELAAFLLSAPYAEEALGLTLGAGECVALRGGPVLVLRVVGAEVADVAGLVHGPSVRRCAHAASASSSVNWAEGGRGASAAERIWRSDPSGR